MYAFMRHYPTLRDEFDQRANQCSSNDSANQRQTPIATNVILGTTSHAINRRGSFSCKMGPAHSGGVAATRNLSLFLCMVFEIFYCVLLRFHSCGFVFLFAGMSTFEGLLLPGYQSSSTAPATEHQLSQCLRPVWAVCKLTLFSGTNALSFPRTSSFSARILCVFFLLTLCAVLL